MDFPRHKWIIIDSTEITLSEKSASFDWEETGWFVASDKKSNHSEYGTGGGD